MNQQSYKPDWSPTEDNDKFAARILKGESASASSRSTAPPRRRRVRLSIDDYVQGVLNQDRATLARTITLVESNSPAHMKMAQEVLQALMPYTGDSIRVGITGVPGVGKSTFIDTLGAMLCEQDYKVAVLAVDPSSSVTGGSILGDKTRMPTLARHANSFIRPSPTGGMLGGVTRKSRETALVCEAAGFNVILVETVGVGQSEIAVRSMVDFFLLLMLTGAGDELQGIKKGTIELANALLFTKADGDNIPNARAARAEYARVVHYLTPVIEGWTPRVLTCSSLTGEGIPQIWEVIDTFRQQTVASGIFEAQRQAQTLDWMRAIVEEHLYALFFENPNVQAVLPQIEQAVANGEMPPTVAAQELLKKFSTGSGSPSTSE